MMKVACRSSSCGSVALALGVFIGMLLLMSKMETEIARLEDAVQQSLVLQAQSSSSMQSSLANLQDGIRAMRTHKFSVPLITPVKHQAKRGTCWAFTTMSILEQSYRRQGVENGWLTENDYIPFSEQAYGIGAIQYCTDNPDHCPFVRLAQNNTDGGFTSWLFFFHRLRTKVVPSSACGYMEKRGFDHICVGLPEAFINNPLRFSVTHMDPVYDILEIKDRLRKQQQPLAWVSMLTTVTYYIPCTGSFAASHACNVTSCKACPIDKHYPTKCCVKETRVGWTLEGEFYKHRDMHKVGGHAMTVVGYNDNFVTEDGTMGGFIIKNSWGARYSHSMQYWMEEISAEDESENCPNSRNPRNWQQGETELNCIDSEFCDTDSTYILTKIRADVDDTSRLCFTKELRDRHNYTHSRIGDDVPECSPPMPIDLFADFFQPIPEQLETNDADTCGFFFFPYSVLAEARRKFGFFWTNDFDITWHPQSYLANADRYSHLNYTNLRLSQKRQFQAKYEDAVPFLPPDASFSDSAPVSDELHHNPLHATRRPQQIRQKHPHIVDPVDPFEQPEPFSDPDELDGNVKELHVPSGILPMGAPVSSASLLDPDADPFPHPHPFPSLHQASHQEKQMQLPMQSPLGNSKSKTSLLVDRDVEDAQRVQQAPFRMKHMEHFLQSMK